MSRRVLLVLDSQTERAAVLEMLCGGYPVDEAENEKEAYAVLVSSPYAYSAVITDTSVPALMRQIRKNNVLKQLPILTIIGETNDQTMIDLLNSGATSCIARPIRAELLLPMLRNLVQLKESAATVSELPLLLSTIMEASNDYAFAKDESFRYICCSPAFLRLAGLTDSHDVVGRTDFELFPKEMAEQFRQNDLALLTSGKPMVDFKEIVHSQDGEPHYCLASKHILRDAAGECIGIYGVSRDVTEAHNMVERLQLLNDSIPGGIVTFSVKEQEIGIVYFNDGFCILFGGTREGLENRVDVAPLDWVLEEDREKLREQIHTLVTSSAPMDVLFRVHVLDGTVKWVNGKATVAERRGDAVRINAVLLDVTEREKVNEKLRISEEESRLAVQLGGSVVCRYDIQEKCLSIAPSVASAYGLSEVIYNVPSEPVRLGFISPESVAAYQRFFEALQNGSKTETILFQQRYLGRWRWLEGRSATIFSDEGKPIKAVVTLLDVTDRLEQESIYLKWQHSLEDRELNSFTLMHVNLNRNITYDSKEGTLLAFDMVGEELSFNDRARAYANQCVYKQDREAYVAFTNSDAMLAGYYRGRRSDSLDYRELMASGTEYRWLRLSVDLSEYPNSSDVGAYLMYENIDESKRAEMDAKERAENDPLTGALNRATFKAKVDERTRLSAPNQIHALLMLDIDGFKLINDVFGHGAGDQELIDVTAKLNGVVRREDFVGRIGGDEFVVFLSDLPDDKVAAKKAQQVCDLMRKSFSVEVQVSGSVGIAMYPKDGADFDALYEKADATLYYVKDTGKNNFAFYRDGINEDRQHEAHEQTGTVTLKKKDVKRRMLIVDDSVMDCTLLTRIFKDDFRIDVVSDGPSALTKMHHYGSALSVVLLDLNMPGMDGHSVLEKMQQGASTKGIPVIIVSGSSDRETVLKVISSGASDLVTKPIDPELLQIRVNSAISKAENERLRAQNSVLSMLNDEINSYQTVLDQIGTAVIVSYWISGNYLYSPSVSTLLAGRFDTRPLWRILLSDMVADTATVQTMQELVHEIASDRGRTTGKIVVRLKAADGAVRPFEMNIYKQVNEYGLTERMVLTLSKC